MSRSGSAALRPRRRWPGRLIRWLLWIALLLLLVSVLQVLLLRWIDPPTGGVMLQRRLELYRAGEDTSIDYRWRDWDAVSAHLKIAVVAAEDQRFAQHDGFDTEAIRDAWSRYRGGGARLRGGSTISQQVAKNLFLWSDRSWLRKGLEAWYTLLVEALWPKRRILEVYVNVAEFGDRLYGAEAAAQRYFGRSAAQLDAEQSARLAAVLPSPRRYSVTAPTEFVRGRQRWIAGQVRQLGGTAYLETLGTD